MTGSVIAGVAIFCSSFSPNIPVLGVTYGLLGGIGLGLMWVNFIVLDIELMRVVLACHFFHNQVRPCCSCCWSILFTTTLFCHRSEKKWSNKIPFPNTSPSPGLCVTGSGVGTFVFAPIASALVEWAGWRGCNRVWSSFQYLFLFKFKFLSLVQVKTYLLCLDHQVMAAICSLGFLCGLALAPRARKPSRWWQDLRHF